MDQTEKTPKQGTRRWVKIVLALSLAVNLLVIGLFVGAVGNHLRDGHDDPRRRPGGDASAYLPYVRALPEASRDRMKDAFRDRAPEFRKARKDLRAGFTQLQNALRAVPYDEAEVRAVLDGQRSKIDEQVIFARDLFLQEIAQMSDGERAKLADDLKKVLRRGPSKFGDNDRR